MAPSVTAANTAYSQAVNRLVTICHELDSHLPPFDLHENDDPDPTLPSVWPRPKLESTTGCAQCVEELQQLEPGDRERHICNHRELDESVDTRSGSADESSRVKVAQRRTVR